MPRLIRSYIINCLIGFAAAGVFVGMLLWFDVAHLRHLILTSDKGWLALLILWFANGIVFAGVQFAVSIMLRGDDDDDGPGGGRRAPVRIGEPVRVRAEARSGQHRTFR